MNTPAIVSCCLLVALCGCGPSAKQLTRQHFREGIAAVKVCTQGATYAEFRDKSLALETIYAANQSTLTDKSKDVDQLVRTMKATDSLWSLQMQIESQFPNFVPDESRGQEMAQAMLIIQKASHLTHAQIKADGNYFSGYVQHGLTLISSQCDDLLK